MIYAGFTSCIDLIGESYGLVISEKFTPKTDEEVSYLVNAAYVPWRETMLLWNGVVRAQELCADQDVILLAQMGGLMGYLQKMAFTHLDHG